MSIPPAHPTSTQLVTLALAQHERTLNLQACLHKEQVHSKTGGDCLRESVALWELFKAMQEHTVWITYNKKGGDQVRRIATLNEEYRYCTKGKHIGFDAINLDKGTFTYYDLRGGNAKPRSFKLINLVDFEIIKKV